MKSGNLSEWDKKQILDVIEEKDDVIYSQCLGMLSRYLYSHYNKRSIMLIDDYETMIKNKKDKNHYNIAVHFVKSFLISAVKDNEYLEKSLLTSVFQVGLDDFFSGPNILLRSTLSKTFADKFGFTQEEINDTLIKFNLQDKAEEVKDWYNGYFFGGSEGIYNPNSIINYLENKEFKSYLISDDMKNLMLNADFDVKYQLDFLLKDKSINVWLEDHIDNELMEDTLWSILLFNGYLKSIGHKDYSKYDLVLVNNKEIISFMKDIMYTLSKE